jgi:decaprenylphospho-beta-D-ribofuranose 2-oxidase
LTEVLSNATPGVRTRSTRDPAQDTDSGARAGEPWPEARCDVSSFDGGVRAHTGLQRPDRYRFWNDKMREPRIPRGAGLSYAAASFREGGLSIEHTSFDRILDFDSEKHIVEVESGISLDALHRFLGSRALFLKVQPGYGRITVGGCIAADAHGKNQARDGTFINQVAGLTLFHPTQGLIDLDASTEPELFRLTCGGYGLTGHIIKARLRASPVPSNTVEVRIEPATDVRSGTERLTSLAAEMDFVYSWHDFSATGAAFGRGFVCAAHFVPDSHAPSTPRAAERSLSLSAASRAAWRVPLLNRWTTKAMNIAYPKKQMWRGGRSLTTLGDALFPVHTKQLYFKLFGTAGFHEFQAIIPTGGVVEYTEAIRDYLVRRPIAITLASGKVFRGQRELLRFTGEGLCLALNFPRTRQSRHFLEFLDGLIVSLGGVPSLIKDSRLPHSVVEATYPEAQRFRETLHAFDPKRWFRSELSDRLRL